MLRELTQGCANPGLVYEIPLGFFELLAQPGAFKPNASQGFSSLPELEGCSGRKKVGRGRVLRSLNGGQGGIDCAPLHPSGVRNPPPDSDFGEGLLAQPGAFKPNASQGFSSLPELEGCSGRKKVGRGTILRSLNGGQGGIRTLGNIAATHAFQASPFDHSGTCPKSCER